MNDIQRLFKKDVLSVEIPSLPVTYDPLKNWISGWDEEKNDPFIESLPDDYLYNYYVTKKCFKHYFSPKQYLFCTVNLNLTIGSIYFEKGRIRCVHEYGACYEIMYRHELRHRVEDEDVANILKPININPTEGDRENLSAVFTAYHKVVEQEVEYERNCWHHTPGEKLLAIEEMSKKAFEKQMAASKYENALYILWCLIGYLSYDCRGISEDIMYRFECPLGKNGLVYSRPLSHTSRGLALNLQFDMSTLRDFVSNLVLDVSMCTRMPIEQRHKAAKEFNRYADDYLNSVIPEHLKKRKLFNNHFNFYSSNGYTDACLEELKKFI